VTLPNAVQINIHNTTKEVQNGIDIEYRQIESSLSAENIGCGGAHVKIGKRWIKLTMKGLTH